ncbi:ATP-binding protein [Oculatella sp. LEGE 06141]|nr:ATP-binding protein [Oculatella sp. LEGE 06141]
MTALEHWQAANQRYLSASLAFVRNALAGYVGAEALICDQQQLQQDIEAARAAMPTPSALDRLSQMFDLSPFERDLLLLCAGVELDATLFRLCTEAQHDPQRPYPTFSLALAVLPQPHWEALTPVAPLRRHRLIEVGQGITLTLSPLRITERILHYLVGTRYLDEGLVGFIEPMPAVAELVPSHQHLAEQVALVLSTAATAAEPPIVQLCGADASSKQSIATTACELLGFGLCRLPAALVPSTPAEIESLQRLWTRDSVLSNSVLLLDGEVLDSSDAARMGTVSRLLERTPGLLLMTCRDRLHLPHRPVISFDVQKPTSIEQQDLWHDLLTQQVPSLNGELHGPVQQLVSQFDLNATAIRSACHAAIGQPSSPSAAPDLSRRLWDTCRIQARPRLDELAQRIEPIASWSDLVLPEAQIKILHEVSAHVRQRATVYETWEFGTKGSRGLGISALFAGASGTGKTLAAEVLAHELRLDLYRVDLSSVVSKYIGETEKNLRRVFDAAEDGGVILLFDEADALFGKRSEVKDSRDRYANIEVSYLLQRMECYPGLAILTTNLKSAIDTAFLRRIRFVVQFPFPDASQRAEIWRRVFPSRTPTEGLDPAKLARLNVAGGNIRNIALNAAFLAADAGEAVQMKHLLRSAQTEYAKIEKSLTESEVGGWV